MLPFFFLKLILAMKFSLLVFFFSSGAEVGIKDCLEAQVVRGDWGKWVHEDEEQFGLERHMAGDSADR